MVKAGLPQFFPLVEHHPPHPQPIEGADRPSFSVQQKRGNLHHAENPSAIPYIAYKHPKVGKVGDGELLPQLKLFELVSAKDDKPFRSVSSQDSADEFFAEGPGATRD